MQAGYLRPLLMVLALGALVGCSSGSAELHHWVAVQKQKKGPPLPPKPVIKSPETFTYADQGMRDPFSHAVTDQHGKDRGSGPHPDKNRPPQPLEAFALDSLKMVGSIGSGNHMIALISDPDKKIHRVRVNQYMGQNYGRVIDIHQNRVDLVELVPNGNGGWMERDASIALDTQ